MPAPARRGGGGSDSSSRPGRDHRPGQEPARKTLWADWTGTTPQRHGPRCQSADRAQPREVRCGPFAPGLERGRGRALRPSERADADLSPWGGVAAAYRAEWRAAGADGAPRRGTWGRWLSLTSCTARYAPPAHPPRPPHPASPGGHAQRGARGVGQPVPVGPALAGLGPPALRARRQGGARGRPAGGRRHPG